MTTINRRALIQSLIGAAIAGGAGLTLIERAEAMPLGSNRPELPDPMLEEAQWNTRPPGWSHRPPPHVWRHRRPPRRRWVCWRRHGRQVCGWRWM